MRSKIAALSILFICFSCNSFDKESKGVSEIVNYYGGICKYSVGVTASSNDGAEKYLELELSSSDLVAAYEQAPELPASNMAYFCYLELTGNPRDYAKIKSVIDFNSGKKANYEYTWTQLDLVDKRLSLLNHVVDILKSGRLDLLDPMLNNNSEIKYNKADLLSGIKKIEHELGKIKDFRMAGFRFYTVDGVQLLHLTGYLHREKKNHQVSIDVYPRVDDNQIISLQYQL